MTEKGYIINKLDIDYEPSDKRYWSMIIQPGKENMWITCYKNSQEDFWFRIDSKQKSNITVKTLSMDSLEQIIKDLLISTN